MVSGYGSAARTAAKENLKIDKVRLGQIVGKTKTKIMGPFTSVQHATTQHNIFLKKSHSRNFV